jgi:hypothetical protein
VGTYLVHPCPIKYSRSRNNLRNVGLKLLYNVYLVNRWFLSSAVMALVTYPMLASWFGWWMPERAFEWGLVIAGAAGFVSSLPTVIWGWLEPGTHNLPYPADEDLD